MNLMVDSFRTAIVEHGALIGICVLAIFFALLLLRREVGLKWINTLFIACALWSILIILTFPPRGSNYQIYRYNASLTLSGMPAFGRDSIPEDGRHGSSVQNPRYLDYTGMQHLLYVGMTCLDLSGIHPSLAGFGFQLWSFTCIVVALLLIRYGKGAVTGDSMIQKALSATILSFHPVLVLHWLVYGWEDKVIYLVLPLFLAFLLDTGALTLSALLIGCAVGLNGLFIFFVPTFLLHVFRTQGRRTWLYLGLLGLSLVGAMLPFFPESQSGWANRMARMNAPTPFWFSIYLLLPTGIYTPTLDKAIVAILAIASTLAYWLKRLDIRDMIIMSTSLVIMLGPFNVPQRVVPLIMLIAIFTPCKSRGYWIAFTVVLSVLLLVGRGLDPRNITPLHVATFHIPYLWVLGLYVYKRLEQARLCSRTANPGNA